MLVEEGRVVSILGRVRLDPREFQAGSGYSLAQAKSDLSSYVLHSVRRRGGLRHRSLAESMMKWVR